MQLRPTALCNSYIQWNVCRVLLLQLTVTVHEAVYATGCINQLTLARIERMRGAGDFNLDHRISFSFKLYSLVALACGLRQEHITVGHIFEYDGAIVVGMNTFFHFNALLMFVMCTLEARIIISGHKITKNSAARQIFL